MSEAEKIEFNKVVELKAELEAVAYGDLKKEFETRKIGHVFKPGTKKEVLITLAVEALTAKNDVAATDTVSGESNDITGTEGIVSTLTPEDADKIIKEQNGGVEFSEDYVKPEVSKEGEPHNVGKEFDNQEFEQKPEIIIEGEPKYTREVIEENLGILAATLKVCTEDSRKKVFDKQEYLLAHLAYLDKWEKENK
jgi:hypothetical protein